MKQILLVIGSLREESLNLQLADAIMSELAGKAEVSELEFDDLPWMNQDIEWPTPPEVQRVRTNVSNADGMWFVCPEYNGSYPGHVKNLVDWLSRSQDREHGSIPAIDEKPVTISGAAGRSASRKMQAQLGQLLSAMGARVMSEPTVGIELDREAFATSKLQLTLDNRAAITQQVEAFLAFLD